MNKKILLAVNGTLMRGLKLNGNMIEAGAEFVKEAKTEKHYRCWSIGDGNTRRLFLRNDSLYP